MNHQQPQLSAFQSTLPAYQSSLIPSSTSSIATGANRTPTVNLPNPALAPMPVAPAINTNPSINTYDVYCYITRINPNPGPPHPHHSYLLGSFETRIHAYVDLTIDYCRVLNECKMLNKPVQETQKPGLRGVGKEKAMLRVEGRKWGWEVWKMEGAGEEGMPRGDEESKVGMREE